MSLTKIILNQNFIKNFSILKLTKFNLTTLSTKLTNKDNLDEEGRTLTQGEIRLTNLLKEKFPKASLVRVQDISSGCGSMYDIFVETVEFKNMRLVKRHQLITDTLKNEIKAMHGLTIYATTPDENK